MSKPPLPRSRYSPTVITSSVSSTIMKSVLLAFIGACAVLAATNGLKAQAILGGDAQIRVTGDKPPALGVALPVVTRKRIQINGVDCEQSLPCGQGLLTKG